VIKLILCGHLSLRGSSVSVCHFTAKQADYGNYCMCCCCRNLNPSGIFDTDAWIERILIVGAAGQPPEITLTASGTSLHLSRPFFSIPKTTGWHKNATPWYCQSKRYRIFCKVVQQCAEVVAVGSWQWLRCKRTAGSCSERILKMFQFWQSYGQALVVALVWLAVDSETVFVAPFK